MLHKYVGIKESEKDVYEAQTDEEAQDIAYRLALDIEIYNRDHEDKRTLVISDEWPPVLVEDDTRATVEE